MLAEPVARRFPPAGVVRTGALAGFYNRDFGAYDPELEAVQARLAPANRPVYPRRVDVVAEKVFADGIFKIDPSHNEREYPHTAKLKLRKKYPFGELQGNLTVNDISGGRKDNGSLLVRQDESLTGGSVQVVPVDGRHARYRVTHVGTRDVQDFATAPEATVKVAEIFGIAVEI